MLAGASAVRVYLLVSNANRTVPVLSLVFGGLLLTMPFVVLGGANCRKHSDQVSITAFLFVVVSAVSGIYLDYWHFNHLNIDSWADGVLYIAHGMFACIGALVVVVLSVGDSGR